MKEAPSRCVACGQEGAIRYAISSYATQSFCRANLRTTSKFRRAILSLAAGDVALAAIVEARLQAEALDATDELVADAIAEGWLEQEPPTPEASPDDI